MTEEQDNFDELDENIEILQDQLNTAYAKKYAKTKTSMELMDFIINFINSAHFDSKQSSVLMEELIERIDDKKSYDNYKKLATVGLDLNELKEKTDSSLSAVRNKISHIRDALMGLLMQLRLMQKKTDETIKNINDEIENDDE